MRTIVSAVAGTIAFSLSLAAPAARAHGELHPRIDAVTVRLESAPHDVSLLVLRAELLRLHGDPIAALRDLERAGSFGGDGHVGVHAGRARAHLDREAFADAKASADRWLALAPGDLAGLRLRADVHERLGELDAALADLAVAALLDDAPPDVDLARARLLADAAPPRLDDAIAVLDEGLARRGPIVVLQLAAIDLEERRGEIDAALARLDSITAASPRKEPWLSRRGDLLRRAGRDDDARDAYRAARDAIERIPPHRRATTRLRDLTAHVRRSLEDLNQ